MILVLLIVLPIAGGIAAWLIGRRSPLAARVMSVCVLGTDLLLSLWLWFRYGDHVHLLEAGPWVVELRADWIPPFGIGFHLGLDGLSLLMILLTVFLGLLSVIASWTEIRERVGFFHCNLLWVLGGIIGVFLALDLFLFYVFWEVMLIPMYFLIAVWGHENRTYAAIKFFIFTQASGLFMLLAILGLAFLHFQQHGVITFDYGDLLGTQMGSGVGMLLMLGFFIAFAVKLPAFPFHPWLPDAHTEAPTAGSVILAGLMLKTGAYGLLRFVLPLFPEAVMRFAPLGMGMGVIGILYGAALAFGQSDLKRLVAYTSVSHLGFVLLGVFARNELALQGVVMQMICHAFSTGALFVLVGAIQEQIHTRDLNRLGGLWGSVPRMGGIGMFFAMASLGLPGLGNFVGEFLVLLGSFTVNGFLTIVAATGLVAGTVYSLWIIQQTFHGEEKEQWTLTDFKARHLCIFGSMVIVLLWLGLYPQPVLDTAQQAISKISNVGIIQSSVHHPGQDTRTAFITETLGETALPAPGDSHE